MTSIVRVSHRNTSGAVEVRLPAELADRLDLAAGGSLVAVATDDGILITTEAHADYAEQMAHGRDFMTEFEETFRALAK